MKIKYVVVLKGMGSESFTYYTKKEANASYNRLVKSAIKQTQIDDLPRLIWITESNQVIKSTKLMGRWQEEKI